MSDTPRTDAAMIRDAITGRGLGREYEAVVPLAFARELERELAVQKHEAHLLRTELANADKALENNITTFCELRDERDALREALEKVVCVADQTPDFVYDFIMSSDSPVRAALGRKEGA